MGQAGAAGAQQDAGGGTNLADVGEQIETLLDALETAGPVVHERAEDLVRHVTTLYGAGLERVLQILDDAHVLDDAMMQALVEDDLVSGLLLVHGLHPHDVVARVANALDSVRPYLGSHGGDVELIEVGETGVVRLRMLGSCDGCPSSSVTLKLAVETAIEAAAPEITAIEVEDQQPSASAGLISVDSLRSRIDDVGPGSWEPVPDLATLAPGEVAGFSLGDLDVVACRIGSELFVFTDRCARCTTSMAGATLARPVGAASGTGVLTCPSCRSHFDVRRAGACVEAEGVHLDPLPVLIKDDLPSVAVPAPTGGAGV